MATPLNVRPYAGTFDPISAEQYAAERSASLKRIRAKRAAERKAQAERSVEDLDAAIMALNANGSPFPKHASISAKWEHYSS